MMTTKFVVVALVLLSSFPILAQQADARAQQSASATAAGAQMNQSTAASAQANRNGVQAQGSGAPTSSGAIGGVASTNGSASGPAAGSAQFRPVQGELASKLDSKTAKAGDPVVFKTTEKMRTADGTEIPRGSRIVGHVTSVQAHNKGSEESHLGIVFDRAELKNGQSMAIHSTIESITPSASALAMANNNSDLFASGPAPMGGGFAGGGMAAGGARSGGGMLGGGAVGGAVGGASSLAGNSVRTAGSVAGNTGANLTSGAGSGVNGALGATGSAAASAGGSLRSATLNGAAAGNSVLAAHPTGIPGLMLAGDASGSASGMLSASRKNVHLDSGTQMVLAVSSVLAQ